MPADTIQEQPLVLLVEDSRTTQAVLTRHLAPHHCTLEAHDGEEAWALLQAEVRIGLIITDVNMPRMGGQELLTKIRDSDDPRIRDLPVIVMTAAEDAADRNLAFLNGANDYISKPVNGLELQARVNVHYALARALRELEESRRQLTRLMTTDPLTGLKNRRAFFEHCRQVLPTVMQRRSDVSVLLIDIDDFGHINDEHGYEAGDTVLVGLARTVESVVRGDGTAARLEGGRFALLLPHANRLVAAITAEQVREAVLRGSSDADGGAAIAVTVSVGVATFGTGAESVEQLLEVAGRRVHLAKRLGRNRICLTDDGRATFSG